MLASDLYVCFICAFKKIALYVQNNLSIAVNAEVPNEKGPVSGYTSCVVLVRQLLRHTSVACDRNCSLQALAYSLCTPIAYRIVSELFVGSLERFKCK